MVPIMQRNIPDRCKDEVPSSQESRGRPPHLNEQIAGRRSGGATTLFRADDGSDWGDYEGAQEGVESTQQVNDGNTNVVPPFLAQYNADVVPARLPGTYFENGPQGFRLQRIMDENFRCSSRHNTYEQVGLEQLMGEGMLESFMSDFERVGSPSSMINEVHMSERTSSSSSVQTSWNGTPDQSLILAHISDKMEIVPPSDDDIEWDEFDEFDDFEMSNLDCRCPCRCACRSPHRCCV